MSDEQLRVLDDGLQMIALSLTAAILLSNKDLSNLSFTQAITDARRIVLDARTSAVAGNYR